MKKGFTLAELIGVLVILALIGMIAIPSVTDSIKQNKKKICNISFNNIIEEAKSWSSNNIDKLPSSGEQVEIAFSDLVKYGYSEDNLVDPTTKQDFTDDWKVIITKTENRLEYKIYKGEEYINPSDYCG